MDMRSQLNRTWYAFFARHPAPKPIQVEAVAPILASRNVLLSSATASGKTEAYASPLTELWFDDLRQGLLRLLVVCPTRALVNDLERRLELPFGQCGIKCMVRTGDHPHPLRDSNAGVLLTTPESLDSLLSRHIRDLASVRAIVLDELHVLEGSSRGDQLAILLERLQKVVEKVGQGTLQRVAATATVGNIQAVMDKYLGPGSVLVSVPAPRDISYRCCTITNYRQFPQLIMRELPKTGSRKVLVFVPTRQLVEKLTILLKGQIPFLSSVFAHHGSLSRDERERVESAFLRSGAAICFATSTLEVGIDIGDVDLVILVGAPSDVSAYLQRIGRGNRRLEHCRVLAVSRSYLEPLHFSHLNYCATAGELLGSSKLFRSSILVQQSFSLAFQNPKHFVSSKAVYERLPLSLRPSYPLERITKILDGVVAQGYFQSLANGVYTPTARLERLYTLGRIHHNIDAEDKERTVAVIDSYTQRVVGQISRDKVKHSVEDFSLGGRSFTVVADTGDSVLVKGAQRNEAKFSSRSGVQEVTLEYAEHFGQFLGWDTTKWNYQDCGKFIAIGHFLGSYLGAIFAGLLNSLLHCSKEGACRSNAYVAMIPFQEKLPALENVKRSQIDRVIAGNLAKLRRAFAMGPWVSCLPESMCIDEVADFARVDRLLEACHKRSYQSTPSRICIGKTLSVAPGLQDDEQFSNLERVIAVWSSLHSRPRAESVANESSHGEPALAQLRADLSRSRAPVFLDMLLDEPNRGIFALDPDEPHL